VSSLQGLPAAGSRLSPGLKRRQCALEPVKSSRFFGSLSAANNSHSLKLLSVTRMQKDLKRSAFFLAHHKGVAEEEMFNRLLSRFSDPEQTTTCPICDVKLKWKNLLQHSIKKHPIKIKWSKIPVIRKQKAERRKARRAAGERPSATFVSGGATGLKK